MRAFSFGPYRGGSDPWFRIGNLNVNTTVLLSGIGVFSIFVYVIEGNARSLSKYFWLTPRGISSFSGPSVVEGGIWRLFTWPIMLEPGSRIFYAVILIAIFYMLGSQVEERMGRQQYTAFLLTLTVAPAIVATALDALFGISGVAGGLRFLELAVLIVFALMFPEARFFFGIPAWVMAAGIVVIETLQTTADRNWFGLIVGGTVVLLALLLTRSMGFAEGADWIPRAAVPGFTPGGGYRPSPRPSRSRRKTKLRSVAPPDPVVSDLDDMEIDALLDQVATEGLDSLTKEQRKRLEAHSKRLRKKKDE